MRVEITIKTTRQAVAAIEENGLDEHQVKKLLQAIAKDGSIESVVRVAYRMRPSLLKSICIQRIAEISALHAERLLQLLPVTKPYARARKALLRKYLRQPIYNWIDEPEFEVVHGVPIERYKKLANKEFALCAEVVIRSRSPAYATEMLEHAKRHNLNDEPLLRKLKRIAEKS